GRDGDGTQGGRPASLVLRGGRCIREQVRLFLLGCGILGGCLRSRGSLFSRCLIISSGSLSGSTEQLGSLIGSRRLWWCRLRSLCGLRIPSGDYARGGELLAGFRGRLDGACLRDIRREGWCSGNRLGSLRASCLHLGVGRLCLGRRSIGPTALALCGGKGGGHRSGGRVLALGRRRRSSACRHLGRGLVGGWRGDIGAPLDRLLGTDEGLRLRQRRL